MQRAELAKKLIDCDAEERSRLLSENASVADVYLAQEIRNACVAAWSSDPNRVQRSVVAVRSLVKVNRDPLILANANWIYGISEITKGNFESAVTALKKAAKVLSGARNEADAAQTKVAKLLALAMLGRYDDAIATGLTAIPVLIKHGDELAAGKIEMNLSNIVSRRSQHREAEQFCVRARKRFKKAGEPQWQAMAENGLANTYAELNDFAKAEKFYALAFARAVAAKMHVTEAEIEASMGNLALFRGRYAEALRYLELSRRKFDVLAMPHQTAIADLEIADIYAELNLNAEAIEIYERVGEAFRQLKLRFEEARACLNFGRAAMTIGKAAIAKKQLARSLRLFTLEKNGSGQMAARLAQARCAIDNGDHDLAISIIETARRSWGETQSVSLTLAANLIEGEANLLAGEIDRSEQIFKAMLADAKRLQRSETAQTSLNFLGKIANLRGDSKAAESYFKKSIRIIERLRSPLASEEFSMSFLAARLEPYDNLVRLYLSEKRIADAFRTIESGRSRTLVDALNSNSAPDNSSVELTQIREELNSYYKRLDRAEDDEVADLNFAIRLRESHIAKLTREIASVKTPPTGRKDSKIAPNLKTLKKHLGADQTLIEFVEIDGVFAAFVVNGNKIGFIGDLATVPEIAGDLEDLNFQFDSLRYGTTGMERFLGQMKSRSDACLANLYDRLLRPIEHLLKGSSLVIIPAGLLHYVPFHALYDGENYVVEQFETTYAPSAGVWSKLQERPPRRIENSLLVGFADERIPLVESEVDDIRRIVSKPKTLIGDDATFAAFTKNASRRDLIHLACHGQFRAENPMFSSLHLADGWVTVRDICKQRIEAELVVLSACETGLNKVFPGDEILGLARGFLTAGAASLIVSLWTVNDAAASRLMSGLYIEIQCGHTPAASLRKAKLNSIERGEHPYLWSPFILIGR